VKVGQTETEKKAKSLQKCREIVSEINNFGINDFERLQIIYLLSLELEDRVLVEDFAEVIKGHRGDIFENNDNKTKLIQ
jgi:hypothetical protein